MFFEEVDADGLLVVLGEVSFAVALDHARLADRPVADDDDLEQGDQVCKVPFRLRIAGASIARA